MGWIVGLALASALLGAVLRDEFATPPGLIGFGCHGYDQPIMAKEEDDFPTCDAIVRVDQLGNLPLV